MKGFFGAILFIFGVVFLCVGLASKEPGSVVFGLFIGIPGFTMVVKSNNKKEKEKKEKEKEIIKYKELEELEEDIDENKNRTRSTINSYGESGNVYYESSIRDYNSFTCNGKRFDTEENNILREWNKFFNEVNKSYGKISIKFEEVKQFGSLNEMISYENDTHTFFKERILSEAQKNGFIDSIEWNNPIIYPYEECDYRMYMGIELTKREFLDAINIFKKHQENIKNSAKKDIYDLYCKTLRRIGIFYKSYKYWDKALYIFEMIEQYGFAGINDSKSIIKCKKELSMKNKNILEK